MKKSMIVWVPIDILYSMETDNSFRLYRAFDENDEDKKISIQDIFDRIDEEFIEEKINQ